jgi:GTP-binding protein LepA
MQNIRNFSIIAHIDHGKSTLADRLLEFTHTVENRKMKDQVLDSMDLERERGITIKMTPVRMEYKNHILNLIDTPGHIDFSYEVSRSLRAVEGALLLVDATQGVQAQTLTTLEMAKNADLKIIPVINKIDSPLADIEGVKKQIIKLLNVEDEDIILVSGKTGVGVENLLEEILKKIPSPKIEEVKSKSFRALIFDFEYSNHEGVILYVRILNGSVKRNDELTFIKSKYRFLVRNVGVFKPQKIETKELKIGDKGQYLNQAGTYRIEEIKTEEERQWVIDCNGFKVCGTVSKDALSFVDEDMLFDDYSINVITPEGLQYIENLIEEGEEWVGREFAILGPCGHFH